MSRQWTGTVRDADQPEYCPEPAIPQSLEHTCATFTRMLPQSPAALWQKTQTFIFLRLLFQRLPSLRLLLETWIR